MKDRISERILLPKEVWVWEQFISRGILFEEQFSIWLVFKRAIFHGTVFREGRTFYQKMVITWGRFRRIFLVSFFTKQNQWQVPCILLWFGSQWPLRNTSWRLRSISGRKRYYSNNRGKLFGGSPSYLSRRSVFSKSAVIETSVMVSNLLKLQFYVLEVYLNTDIFRLACKFLAQIFSKHPVVTKYNFKNKINNSYMLYIQKGVCFLLKYYYYQTKSTKAEAATGGVP